MISFASCAITPRSAPIPAPRTDSTDGSVATVVLKKVIPQTGLQTHLVFDKSIFKDCNVTTDSSGTTVTLNTRPVEHFSVVPLEGPSRLLMTFTPQDGALKTSSAK